MKTIIAATDFSPAALNAAQYAADMAATIDAELMLLHVVEAPIMYNEVPVAVNPADMMKDAMKSITQLQKELHQRTKGKIEIGAEVKEGMFFPELEALCEQLHPYTVVMGSQGTSAAERLFFGAHAVRAARNLDWPLITVPPDVKFSSVKKIGLACDFDEVTGLVPVDEIKMLVKDFNASLHILNTGKEKVFDPNIIYRSGRIEEMLEGIRPEYHFITHTDTDEGIMEFAEKNGIDILVVFPKRHGLIDKLVHKSHTKKMILHSHVPVMALHQ